MANAWGPVLQVGAEAFASAFGSAIGQGLGDALVDAILGKGQEDKDLAEVKAALARIEGKIDYLTRYVINVLPKVIYDGALLANLAVEMERFKALRMAVDADLAKYRGSPSKDNKNDLSDSTKSLLVSARTLAGFGVPYYSFVAHAGIVATSSFTQFFKNGEMDQGDALKEYARHFVEVMTPWMDATNPATVPAQLQESRDIFNLSQGVLSRYLGNVVPHFILAIWGPQVVPVSGVVGVNVYQYKVLIGYIDRQQPPGYFTGGDPFTVFAQFDAEPSKNELPQKVSESLRVGDSKQQPLILDWCPPMTNHPHGWHYGDFRHRAVEQYNRYHALFREGPERIRQQELVRDVLQKTLGTWSSYANGPK